MLLIIVMYLIMVLMVVVRVLLKLLLVLLAVCLLVVYNATGFGTFHDSGTTGNGGVSIAECGLSLDIRCY